MRTMSDDLDLTLLQAGYRTTRQRRAVYDVLASLHNHPTAEEVYASVRPKLPRISLATVYKALESLVVAGLARKIGGLDGTAHFDPCAEEHYHATCRGCGAIFDIPPDPGLQRLLAQIEFTGFSAEKATVDIVGVCDRCRRGLD